MSFGIISYSYGWFCYLIYLQFWSCKFLLSLFFSLLLLCSSLSDPISPWPSEPPVQKQVGCYSPTRTWQLQSQNQQAAGLSSWQQGYVLVLAFLSPQLLSQSPPSLSHTQPSFLTWWALLQPWLQALLWFLNACRALLFFWSLYFIGAKLFIATASNQPTAQETSVSDHLFAILFFYDPQRWLLHIWGRWCSFFVSLSFCPSEIWVWGITFQNVHKMYIRNLVLLPKVARAPKMKL